MLDFEFNGPLDILKWVGIVLAAGFVGYFGRYLSMLIIERLHRKKAGLPAVSREAPTQAAGGESGASEGQLALEKNRAKLSKKKAKLAVKRAKKGG